MTRLRAHESLQLEIITVLEPLNRLRESPADLEKQASQLAEEIKELSGVAPSRESISCLPTVLQSSCGSDTLSRTVPLELRALHATGITHQTQ